MLTNYNWLGKIVFYVTWPGIWLCTRWSTRTRVLIRVGDEILVTKTWLSDGGWSLPGGGLHRGEDPRLGALREVQEETGIVLREEQLVPLLSGRYHSKGIQFYCHYFVVELDLIPNVTIQKGEISAAVWMRLSDIPDRADGAFKPDILTALKAQQVTS